MNYNAQIVICGASLGGTVAAYSAAKCGKTVLLIEKTDWIGGQLTSQAVPPDEHPWIEYGGCTRSYRNYRNAVRAKYLADPDFSDEVKREVTFDPADSQVSFISHPPALAHENLSEMLAPFQKTGMLTIVTGAKIVGATTDGGIIKSVELIVDGEAASATGDIFIDGTDTGELLYFSGLKYVTGAESRADTGEEHASKHASPDDMQPFVFTAAVENRKSGDYVMDKPDGYDEFKKLVAPYGNHKLYSMFGPDSSTGNGKQFGMFAGERDNNGTELFPLFEYRRIVRAANYSRGHEYDVSLINWPQNDYFMGNLFGADGYSEQNENNAKLFTLGFVYWLQTEAPRADGGKGYPYFKLSGELLGTGDGLSKAPYVRESRRIVSEFRITENDVKRGSNPVFYDSVGVGSYAIDLHITSKTHTFLYAPTERFTIPLGAMITREHSNFIPACKNIGTTHLTNGCYRLHPIEWNIGEVAGLLAAYALDRRCEIHEVRDDMTKLNDFRELVKSCGIPLDWSDCDINKISIKAKTKPRGGQAGE